MPTETSPQLSQQIQYALNQIKIFHVTSPPLFYFPVSNWYTTNILNFQSRYYKIMIYFPFSFITYIK